MIATIDEDAAESAMFPWLNTSGSWTKRRIKFAVKLINDKVEASEISLPYIGLDNIESWTGRLSMDGLSSADGQATLFRPGDVLFGKLRPYLAKVLRAREPGMCSTEAFVLRPDGRVDPDFLAYFLLNRSFVDVVDGSTYGSKMPRASWEFVGKLPLMLPPLTEQRTIAAFLDQRTAKIDALIAKKERLLALLAEKRQAIITRAVTKGLDPKASMKDTGISWLGKIPAHWDIARLRFVTTLESGHTPNRQNPDFWEDCDIPWVSLNDSKQLAAVDYIHDTAIAINTKGLAGSSARILPERTVVFTRDATIGLAAITARPMAVSQHLIAWIPGPKVSAEFVLAVLYAMRPDLDRFTFGATIKTIGLDDVRTLTTPVPPRNEQDKICIHIKLKRKSLQQISEMIETAIVKLKELRAALITAAVTGKIDVAQCL